MAEATVLRQNPRLETDAEIARQRLAWSAPAQPLNVIDTIEKLSFHSPPPASLSSLAER